MTRDLTAVAFSRALQRNKLREGSGGVEWRKEDDPRLTDASRVVFSFVCQRKPFKILRRQTLSSALRQRDDYLAILAEKSRRATQ